MAPATNDPDDPEDPSDDPGDVTRWLHRLRTEDDGVHDALAPLVYDELHRMAVRAMRNENSPVTLQPTALVHEAWMRLVQQHSANFADRQHFFSIAAQIMRRVLVDQARRRGAAKRDGGVAVPIDRLDIPAEPTADATEVLRVHEALEALAQVDARQAKVVELRFFAGLSNDEIAQLLEISERTVKRDWSFARAWLHRRLAEHP